MSPTKHLKYHLSGEEYDILFSWLHIFLAVVLFPILLKQILMETINDTFHVSLL